MYEYISGKLIAKQASSAVVDVHGIGYQIQIPLSTFSTLPEAGDSVRLLTYLVVREDLHALFGFFTEAERQLFKLLITISGIGPKSAMTVLSGLEVNELKRAIIDGNLAVLTSISGIGRKTAERIIVELREKLLVEGERVPFPATEKMKASEILMEDSLRALLELGYRKQNAQEAIQKALKNLAPEKFSVSDLIRASLKHVS